MSEISLAKTLIKSGDKREGKKLLIRLLKENPLDEQAWMWMTAVVNSIDEQIECLARVIKINPYNKFAREGLEKLDNRLNRDTLLEAKVLFFEPAPLPSGSENAVWSYDIYMPEDREMDLAAVKTAVLNSAFVNWLKPAVSMLCLFFLAVGVSGLLYSHIDLGSGYPNDAFQQFWHGAGNAAGSPLEAAIIAILLGFIFFIIYLMAE